MAADDPRRVNKQAAVIQDTGAAARGEAPAPSDNPAPAPVAKPAAPAGGGLLNTLSMNNPLAGTAAPTAGASPSLHSNQAVNEALAGAFRPIVPDQINSLLGPAIGQIQGHTNPIAFYQPRQTAPVPVPRKLA